MQDKIVLVSDGVIIIVSNAVKTPEDNDDQITLTVQEYGADLRVSGQIFVLPVTVLEHLEQSDGTFIYLYLSSPFAVVTEFMGGIEIGRDEILKAKGAWEYSYAHAPLSRNFDDPLEIASEIV